LEECISNTFFKSNSYFVIEILLQRTDPTLMRKRSSSAIEAAAVAVAVALRAPSSKK